MEQKALQWNLGPGFGAINGLQLMLYAPLRMARKNAKISPRPLDRRYKCVGIPMDSLVTLQRALTRSDPLGAMNGVAVRDERLRLRCASSHRRSSAMWFARRQILRKAARVRPESGGGTRKVRCPLEDHRRSSAGQTDRAMLRDELLSRQAKTKHLNPKT
jgi:hypothetical protein